MIELYYVQRLNVSPDEARLRILTKLEAQPDLKQRDLARELGISLGKVNYCLRALIAKGFVKAEKFRRADQKAAYIYVLTPHGFSEKRQQLQEFLQYKQAEYETLRAEIVELSEELARTRDPVEE